MKAQQVPKIEQNREKKYSFSLEESKVVKRTSRPGDGDVIHLDISAPRLSDERVAEFLKGDAFLNLKKP